MPHPSAIEPAADRRTPNESKRLFVLLLLFGILLSLLIVPGVFIIDEPNYLSTVVGLRHGSWSVPSTAGLPPSRELVAFDPESHSRSITSTPVTSLAPPLYALLAWPFSWFGWPALFTLNIVAFLTALWCVYSLARESGGGVAGAILGTALLAFGAPSLEYAVGMWPHMVSSALVTASVLWAVRAMRGGHWHRALAAGVLAGIAVGVREQTIVIGLGLGLSLLLFARPRLRPALFYGLGLLLPLLLIATINHARLGIFHPIPKLGAYTVDVRQSAAPASSDRLEPLAALWAKVVDFRQHPPFADPMKERLFRKDPATGVPIVGGGVVKKALLQSAPWMAAAFVLFLAGWWAGPRGRAPLRTLSAVGCFTVFPMILAIAAAGFGRSDGLAYNQRYFLELIPISAAVVGAAAGPRLQVAGVLGGFAVAVVGFVALFAAVSSPLRYGLIATIPLVLSLGAVIIGASWFRPIGRLAPSVLLGLAIGWGGLIHVVDDLRASRDRRTAHWHVLQAIEPHLPQGAALFTYGGGRDAVGPLMLGKDVLILDAWADGGADARLLLEALLARGQRVFVRADGFPSHVLDAMASGFRLVKIRADVPALYEIELPS